MNPLDEAVAEIARDVDQTVLTEPTPVLSQSDDQPRLDARLAPVSTADTYRCYLDATILGYLVYVVGAITGFLAIALSLSDAQAGLHSSAMAIGMIAGGLSASRFDRRIGSRRVHWTGLAMMALAILLLVWSPALVVTLAGAAMIGLGLGFVLTHANQMLAAGGGALARVRIARATLISMVGSLSVPLVIEFGVSSDMGWWVVAIPILVLLGIGIVVTRGRAELPPSLRTDSDGRLSRAYWTGWSLLALFVAIEFAIVVWGGTLVAGQAGVTLATATLVISIFSGGVILGRFALSFHAVSERDPIVMLRAGIVLTLVGAVIAWASASYEVSLLAFFLAGLGLAALFPIGAALTMATEPLQAGVASGRLVLANGLAILSAPLLLGIIADTTGVESAWLLIPVLCLVALGLTVLVARNSTGEGPVVVPA